ncbi:methyltransferase family protein [Pelotalea chapellei]|uniref:Isoprenylcysteine carboxylmethyltransferase family protein n=1 Tax=Pelotalea chapellei TaxID=44671 RepID=A0ABS5UCW6_9BACT|nr:isoprenylcysteine carboxylmethyltransferase family protein [Pelotalea chapellei]MBT1073530.1 isoprenylcysteine carboxylmethyltransferase family protein [Pelotalea chapellei]
MLNHLYKEHNLSDFTIFILRFISFAVVHSLFANPRIKLIVSRYGDMESPYYRLLYNIASLIMFGWVMAAYRTSRVLYFASGVWSLVMYLVQFLIACLLFACVKQTGINQFLGFQQLHKKTRQVQLVTTGCYSMVRHPVYLLSLLFLVFNPVMSVQWFLLILLSSAYFVVGAIIEEKRLLKQFEKEYREYQQRVPFFFPAINRIIRSPGAKT